MTFESMENQAAQLLKAGELRQLEQILLSWPIKSKKLIILKNIINIFYEEVKNDAPYTIFDYSTDFNEIINHYIRTKLLIRRLDFDLPEEYQHEFCDYCNTTGVSGHFLAHLLSRNVFYPDKVYAKFELLFSKKDGENN